MKTIFARNLEPILRERAISQSELARRTGIRQSSISDYLAGKYEPKQDKVDAIASALGVSPSVLVGVRGQSTHPDIIRVPVLGRVPAGVPIDAIEEVLDYEELSSRSYNSDKQYFALRVEGDSMTPQYLDGDVVIVEQADDCNSGSDCVVVVNDNDATLKRVFKYENGSLELRPLNTSYKKVIYTADQIVELPVRINGVVREIRRKVP